MDMIPLTWEELAHGAYDLDPEGRKIRAVAFAVRAGHSDDMAGRFLAQLCAMNLLDQPGRWGDILAYTMSLRPDAAHAAP